MTRTSQPRQQVATQVTHEERAWIGKSVPRKENKALVTGHGHYVADIHIPGMLEVAFVRSSVAHAQIRKIDVTEATALDGVIAIMTAEDLVDRVAAFTRFVDQEHTPPGLAAAVDPVIHPCPMDVLADKIVRYVGQPVVAVVAVNRYVAEDAAEIVQVEYDELPAVVDVEDAVGDGSPLVNDSVPGNIQADFEVVAGNPDEAFSKSENQHSFRIQTQRVSGHPMETRGVLATVDNFSGDLTVWSSTQVPHMVRTRIAEQLGIAEQTVRVIAPHVGGGFGPKVQVYPEEVLIPHLARTIGRPIRWIEDRREHLISTAQARDQIHFIDVAFDNSGLITAIRDRFLLDCGAYNPFSITCAYNTAAHIRSLYKVPHMAIRGQCVLTNKTFNVPFRGAGRPEGVFTMDRVIYEVARILGLQAADVLRHNLIEAEQMPYSRGMPYRDGEEIVYDCGDFRAAFDDLCEHIGFKQHKSEQESLRQQGIYRGIGFGTYIEGTGIGPFEGANVSLTSTGKVAVVTGSTSQGQSHNTVMSQIVAEVFDEEPNNIEFREGDTSLLPYGVGTFASRSAVVAGSAALISARNLRDQLFSIAGELLEVAVSDLEMSRGTVRVKGSDVNLNFAQLYEAAKPGPGSRLPAGMEPGVSQSQFWVPPTVTWGFGMTAALVEVDIATGEVDLKKIAIVHDCGRLINPLVVEGQIQGGVVQGIGGALYEEIVYDTNGQPLTTTLMDYLLPTSAEIPEIEQIHIEAFSDRNPLGVKGVGEAGALSPPAAIANAVVDALAAEFDPDIYSLPLSPAKVRGAIERSVRQS